MRDVETGGYDAKPLLMDCPPEVRAGFVKRVYGLLFMQMLVTGGTVALMSLPPVARFVVTTPALVLMSGVGGLFVLCALSSHHARHPCNLLLLLAFTLCQSYTIGFVIVFYAGAGLGYLVVSAFMTTTLLFGAFSTAAHFSRRDFAGMAPYVGSGLAALLLLGCVALFAPGLALQGVFASLGVCVFSCLVLYDTSLLLNTMRPDEAVIASVQLYIDFLNLFLYTLDSLRLCSS